MSDTKPKKQFKSQSVNDLFRQASSSASNDSINNQSSASQLRSKAKTTQKTTKLKLLPRKVRPTPKRTSTSTSPSPSPDVGSSSTSSSKITTRNSSMEFSIPFPLPQSQSSPTQKEEKEQVQPAPSPSPHDKLEKPDTTTHTTNKPQQSRFNWEDDKEERSWSNFSNRSEILTDPKKTHEQLYEQISPESSLLWSSPNSKISSFRKSVGSPSIQSIHQSPLSRPVDSSSSSSAFFNDSLNTSPLFNLQSRQHSEVLTRPRLDDQFWSTTSSSSNIWNNHGHEERQLSTKSDSAVPWTPFDVESLSLDEPFGSLGKNFHNGNGNRFSIDSSNRNTSRFFPSPTIPQSHQFPDQSIPPQIAFEPTSEIIPELNSPTELVSMSMETEDSLFKSHFQISDTTQEIPISLYTFTPTNTNRDDYTHTQRSTPRKNSEIELSHYPEGFSSTFYKRGSNNFMFIRELQPKIMTSKFSDKVDIKITLPISSNDGSTIIKSEIVEINRREFEGRTSLKYNKSNDNNHGHHGHGHGHGHYSRKFIHGKPFKRK